MKGRGTRQGITGKGLTPERLRAHQGLECLNDEQAIEVIHSLERLSSILFDIYKQVKQQSHETDRPDKDLRKR